MWTGDVKHAGSQGTQHKLQCALAAEPHLEQAELLSVGRATASMQVDDATMMLRYFVLYDPAGVLVFAPTGTARLGSACVRRRYWVW